MRHSQLAQALGLLWNIVPPPDEPPANSGGGGGGGGGSGEREKPISEVVASLVRRHGDAPTALAVLAQDNLNYRRRHREHQTQAANLLKPGTRQDGSVLLSVDEAKELAAYRAMGKPDAVKQTMEKVGTLEGQQAERARSEMLVTAAGAIAPGVTWQAKALEDLVKANGLHVEMRDTTEKDPKTQADVVVKRPHVRPAADANAALMPLKGWVESNAAHQLPALTAAAATGGSNGAPPVQGIGFHQTTRTDTQGGAGGDPVSRRLAKNHEKATAGSVLNPKPAGTGSTT